MSKGVVLPTRSSTWARGRPTGGGSAPAPGFGFDFDLATSDQIDSAMPWKTHTGRSVWLFAPVARQWRGRDRRKFSINDERSNRLTGRSCGEFPCTGRTFAFAPLLAPLIDGPAWNTPVGWFNWWHWQSQWPC